MDFDDFHFFHLLKKQPSIQEIWLYGSRARGDHSPRSDIDLAIVCPSATSDEWCEIEEILNAADTLLKIDWVRFDTLPSSDKLTENILRFKKILYKKGMDTMEKEFWKDSFESLGQALQRLREMLDHPDVKKIDYLRDATIQRFEFCMELYWKTLKKFLASEEVQATTPRDVLSKAYQYNFIDDEKMWLRMLHDRNRTSHIYKEEEAKLIFEKIFTYGPILEKNYEKLRGIFYKE